MLNIWTPSSAIKFDILFPNPCSASLEKNRCSSSVAGGGKPQLQLLLLYLLPLLCYRCSRKPVRPLQGAHSIVLPYVPAQFSGLKQMAKTKKKKVTSRERSGTLFTHLLKWNREVGDLKPKGSHSFSAFLAQTSAKSSKFFSSKNWMGFHACQKHKKLS